MEIKGLFTALITPFFNGKLDKEGLRILIQKQCKAKVAGVVLLGTTGESATLSEEEQEEVIRIGIEEAKGKILLFIGTGCNATKETIKTTQRAEKLGADGALVVCPYYNRPSQEGIYEHYRAISQNTTLPILVYNHPGRTGVNIETATLLKIAGLPQVIGVKEASGNLCQVSDVIAEIVSIYPDFVVLSGDDILTLPMLSLGAKGVISIVGNLVPEAFNTLIQAGLEGKFEEARRLHFDLLPLFKLSCIEVNPTPIKHLMQLAGLPAGSCRLPLYTLKEENQKKLKEWFDLKLNYLVESEKEG
ncbi:MAG: dihydrodipicolinate synthase [Chlamydiota bacterium]|jgi:4-hydroxy-tetrahydrodipicolinate synthase